jgi:hypothetical protein
MPGFERLGKEHTAADYRATSYRVTEGLPRVVGGLMG